MKAGRVLILIVAVWVLGAWALMLTAGVVHHECWPSFPPLGYATALKIQGIALVAAVVSGFLKAALLDG